MFIVTEYAALTFILLSLKTPGKMHPKMLSASFICCTYLITLLVYVSIRVKQCGSTLFVQEAFKIFQQTTRAEELHC